VYGQTIAGLVEVLERIQDPHLGAILDPANFILAGQEPYPDGYEALRTRIKSVHVKDAANGSVVPAGEGEGRFPELLRHMHADGFDGVFALEPHLQSAGKLSGFSGPELFGRAAANLKELLRYEDWEWS
jgi:3-dehydroshikimate dehydratase